MDVTGSPGSIVYRFKARGDGSEIENLKKLGPHGTYGTVQAYLRKTII